LVVGALQALSYKSARGRWVRIAVLAGAAVERRMPSTRL